MSEQFNKKERKNNFLHQNSRQIKEKIFKKLSNQENIFKAC